MANSKNTTWIVGCALWRSSHDGVPDITHCDGRAFRSEDYAQERFNDLVKSFKENGYKLRKIIVPQGKEYFGYRLRGPSGAQGVVFMDRNPVYTQY